MVLRLLLLFLLAASAVDARTVRLLTIGNSFSQNATRQLGGLVTAGGHELIHRPIVVGGASLELHALKARRHAEDPNDKEGRYNDGSSLVELLVADKWDAVTIQQASIKSHDASTHEPFAGELVALIHKLAPQAKLHVHQTWAYRADDPRFSRSSPQPGEPTSRAEMHASLTAAYEALAKRYNAVLLPVGDAFDLAERDPQRGYRTDTSFDFSKAKQPALPDQTHSLHTGWRWGKGRGEDNVVKMRMDGHHANLAGEYLGACVWYEVLFGESPVGNAFIPEGLDADYARFLQETAHRAVQARKGKDSAATRVLNTPGLVAFWDFQEPAGEPRRSLVGDFALEEREGPVARADDGVFGPHSARLKTGQWLMIPRARIGALDIHGPQAQVSVVAWVKREAKSSWQALAGVWGETQKKRQYCLFLNAPRGTRADEMVRYPLANRIHGHVSAIGGPTPGDKFCITYSSGATEISFGEWHCLAMTYDGKASRVYVNGRLDALEHYNPFPYPDGLFDGGPDGADFTVGAVHRGGEWGNFFGGQFGGLAIFSRALDEAELRGLAGKGVALSAL
jgi:hypothetical protein